jgi:hypothetical protein
MIGGIQANSIKMPNLPCPSPDLFKHRRSVIETQYTVQKATNWVYIIMYRTCHCSFSEDSSPVGSPVDTTI